MEGVGQTPAQQRELSKGDVFSLTPQAQPRGVSSIAGAVFGGVSAWLPGPLKGVAPLSAGAPKSPILEMGSDEMLATKTRLEGRSTGAAVCEPLIGVPAIFEEMRPSDEVWHQAQQDIAPVFDRTIATLAGPSPRPIVDVSIDGKSFYAINEQMKALNGRRLELMKALAKEVHSPSDWDRPEVQSLFGRLYTTACAMAEIAIRFAELKSSGGAEAAGRYLGLQEAIGYTNAIQNPAKLYQFAMERRFFDGDLDLWNDSALWVKDEELAPDTRFYEAGSVQAGWRAVNRRYCERVLPVAQHIYDSTAGGDALDLRTLGEMKPNLIDAYIIEPRPQAEIPRRTQWANHLLTMGMALSLIVGVVAYFLARKFGGESLVKYAAAVGLGVAAAGEGMALFVHRQFSRPPQGSEVRHPVSNGQEADLPKQMFIAKGGGSPIFEYAIGKPSMPDLVSASIEAEVILAAVGTEGIQYTPPTAEPILGGVEEQIKGKTLLEINERIVDLNAERLKQVRRLTQLVRKPEDWDRADVKQCFGELHRASCELAETVMRFIELKHPGDVKTQADALAEAVAGHMRGLTDVKTIYQLALDRAYFDEAEGRQKAEVHDLSSDASWNDMNCWKRPETLPDEAAFFDDNAPEGAWRKMFNKVCDRIEPVAVRAEHQQKPDQRLLDKVTRHKGAGLWTELPQHING